MKTRRFASILLIVLMLICCAVPAVAEAGQTYNREAEIKVHPGEYIPNGIDIKTKLRDKGYYNPSVPPETFTKNELDDFTLDALGKLAATYPDMPGYDGRGQGMTEQAWYNLMYQADYIQSIATAAQGYADITLEGGGEPKVIESMQQRLKDLNYLSMNDADYKPGEVSPALFAAMEAFLSRNGFSELYDPNTISAAAQEKLLDLSIDSLVAAEKLSFVEKLRAYFTSSRRILGLNIPMVALWCVGIALIALCVVLFIHFFKADPEGEGGARKGSSTQSRRYRSKPIKFEINYHGSVTTHEESIEGFLKIGRNVGDFPLNMDDTTVSRRHCELFFQDKKLMLKDYSTAGTRINDEMVHDTQREVKSGDTLSIGDHKIKVTF